MLAALGLSWCQSSARVYRDPTEIPAAAQASEVFPDFNKVVADVDDNGDGVCVVNIQP
jgi:hypothetical protein